MPESSRESSPNCSSLPTERQLDITDLIDTCVPELIPAYNHEYPGKNLTILGSFKAWNQIKETRQLFQQLGYWVHAPHGNEITHYTGTSGTFEVLDTDAAHIALFEERSGIHLTPEKTAAYLETLFIRAIDVSDICYVVGIPKPGMTDGYYVGTQVSLEIGFALGGGKHVLGAPISPSLDALDGMSSMWPGYSKMIRTASPYEIASILGLPRTDQ